MVLHDSTEARHAYQHYVRTSCLITNYTQFDYENTACGSMSGPGATCVTKDKTIEEFHISYLIGNGTLVNREIRFSYTVEPEYPRELGSRTECFYNPQNVIDLVSGKIISHAKWSIHAIKILFLVAAGMLAFAIALYTIPWIYKKRQEARNHSNHGAPVRMKIIKSTETKEDIDVKTYVADV
ncbi:unnamed protein product [Adineta ricciae]|uniref:Uncharacterized protein n=1 Tax=Adineta ricciae TaxID=249248 RepID=A0A814J643_ADIRI|nr:unnamed protein product [Adineta ricciae]CAF1416563.1 unnamed protein product [Adineta ricciae]